MQQNKDRILWIDYARAISIIAILLIHSFYFIMHYSYGEPSAAGQEVFRNLYNGTFCQVLASKISTVFFSFRIPALFFISGLVYSLSSGNHKSLTGFIRKKFKRLIIPFFITTLFLTVPVKYISGYWDSSENILLEVFHGQFLLRGVSHLWFLVTLFEIFIIYNLLERLTLRLKLPKLLPLGAMIAIYPLKFYLPDMAGLLEIPKYGMFFALGATIFSMSNGLDRQLDRCARPVTVILYWLMAGLFIYETKRFVTHDTFPGAAYHWVEFLMNLINGIIGITGVVLAAKLLASYQRIRDNRYISFVKENSFKFYQYSDPFNYMVIAFIATDAGLMLFGSPERLPLIYLVRFLISLAMPTAIILLQQRAKQLFNRLPVRLPFLTD